MAHIYHQQIDNSIKENKLYRLNEELMETTDNHRIKLLNEIIHSLSSFKNTHQINEEKLQEHRRILKEEQYKKKWQFLNKDQRLNRLDEFITRNNITDEIKKQLLELFEKGTIMSKHIKYDHTKSIITEITQLKDIDGILQFAEAKETKSKETKLKETKSKETKSENLDTVIEKDKKVKRTVKISKNVDEEKIEPVEDDNSEKKVPKKRVKAKKIAI